MRYAGAVGLEQAGLSASEQNLAKLSPLLHDERPLVAFTALSALFYTAVEPRLWVVQLGAVASAHEHPMVAWKAKEISHMVRHGLGSSSGKQPEPEAPQQPRL